LSNISLKNVSYLLIYVR